MNKGLSIYGKRVIVTGASSGIGRACALALANQGFAVTGISRSTKEETAKFPGGGSLTMRRLDTTKRDDVMTFLKEFGPFDIGVLAAGMGVAGPVENLPIEMAREQIEVNYFGVLNMVQGLMPQMRKSGRGLIVVIGSIAGRLPIPMQSHYSSSKYALEALVEAIRMEAAPYGIRAVIVEPGDTSTGFTAARKTVAETDASVYGSVMTRSVSKMEKDERNGRDPSTVAKAVLSAVSKANPPVRIAVGTEYKLLMFVNRFMPDKFREWVLKKLYA